LYCRYKEEKVIEHIRLFISRINIPSLIGSCRKNLLWSEAVFLYSNYDQNENAIDVMIEHPSAWDHKRFKEIVTHVPGSEIYYRSIEFYLSEHPLLLNDLLLELASKLDHSRVVGLIRRYNHLPLIDKYLLHVQHDNIQAVNEAVNELCVFEEKYKQLRESIDHYDKFDQIALAQQLEKHDLLEFRRISAYLFKLNKRWDKSLELSKQDNLWADAMETASESKNQDLAEDLLYYFVNKNEKECFAACLYTCYELIRPDVVLETAWRFGLTDFAMPYMIQSFRQFTDKISAINTRLEAQEKALQEQENKQKDPNQPTHPDGLIPPPFAPIITPLLTAPSNMMSFNAAPMPYAPMGGGMFPPVY